MAKKDKELILFVDGSKESELVRKLLESQQVTHRVVSSFSELPVKLDLPVLCYRPDLVFYWGKNGIKQFLENSYALDNS